LSGVVYRTSGPIAPTAPATIEASTAALKAPTAEGNQEGRIGLG
jgi:hypothetical protein